MTKNNRRLAALIGVAVLAAPGTAMAKSKEGHGGEARVKGGNHAKALAKGKSKVRTVKYVLKGTYDAADSSVTIVSGNGHVKKAGLVGDRVVFDFTNARLSVGDTNGDGASTLADVVTGDKVQVQLRLPRLAPGAGPYVASRLKDYTHESDDAAEAGETAPAPTAPAPTDPASGTTVPETSA
ncbi:MAG: hypothetical protein M3P40_09845 [Actinomycetota bacterium]|nr:hypothetical protein [Actinomycetota bacterium]